jgi:hypothetical protein
MTKKLVAGLFAAFVLMLTHVARAEVNLALGKTASQSSRSQWSTPNDPQGAVDGIKNGGFGFCTSLQPNPWWQVDLGSVQILDRVVIFNRQDCCSERSRTVHVLLSDDGRVFRDVYAHDGTVFGGVRDGRPLRVHLDGARARFVRLQLANTDYLHFDEVEVFGIPVNDPGPPPVVVAPKCTEFAGRWHRADGALFDIKVSEDCLASVEIPGPVFVQSMQARVVGNEILGGMTRKDRRNGCTVTMRLRLVLEGGRIRASVEGVEGQCDIGPSYRESAWLDR